MAMASTIIVKYVLLNAIIVLTNSESCNYATFSLSTVYPSIPIGTFSLSTNRCQSLKAKLSYHDEFFGLGFDLPFDGSMKLQCYKYNDEFYQIAVNLYDDPLCNNLITFDDEYGGDSTTTEDAMYIDMNNNKFTIYDSTIQFSLDEMNCDLSSYDTDCGISFEMANNCSWSKSDRYLNISVPDAHCTSLAPDFGGILQVLPSEFLPPELVENFQTSSMKYQCCSNDNSLLISNYSDTKCLNKSDSFRISSSYNGQCFVINNNEDIVENDNKRIKYNDNENSKDTYVYIMKWSCHSFEDDCTNIPILDDTFLPKQCSDECITAEQEQESNSNQGKSGGNRGNGSLSSNKKKILGVIGVIVGVIVLFVVVIVVSIVYGRKKAMQQQMERNLGNINNNNNNYKPGDDKYEAFVSNQDNDAQQDMNIVRVADINQSNNVITTNNVE